MVKEVPAENSAQMEELKQEMESLSSNIQIVEKERDFYFEKLRDIEVLLQHRMQETTDPFMESVQKILYASEEDKIIISEDGELIIESANAEDQQPDKIDI